MLMSPVKNVNSEDTARDAILRVLYEVHRKAKSPKTAGKGIRDIQKLLKIGHALKQQQVGRNLDYLVQKGWATEIVEHRTFKTRNGTTQSGEKRSYKISDIGIDRLENASMFQKSSMERIGVNITNINGVSVVGDGNVINTRFTDLAGKLNELKRLVVMDDRLTDTQRLNSISDIESLESQLQKPEPSKTLIAYIWKSIETALTAANFIDLIGEIAGAIRA